MGGDQSARRLLWLLAPATFFDGYGALLLGLSLPLIRDEFGLSLAAAGVVGSLVFAGSFGSLAILAFADRYGRRALLIVTILGYTIATGLTALSQTVVDFTMWQMVARGFLGAERPLASIMVVEALPENRRGRSLAVLSSMIAFGQAAAGLGFLLTVVLGGSWRLLYAIGTVPLIVAAAARRNLPETLGSRPDPGPARLSLGDLRARLVVAVSGLSFLYAVFPTAITVFASTLVIDEWQWKLSSINPAFFVLWALGVSGFFVAGRAMDGWGRRPTGVVFLGGAALAGFVAFTPTSDLARGVGLAAVIFFLTGAAPVVAGFTTEPFAARVRGRIGAVTRVSDIVGSAVAPLLVGLLAGTVGGVGMALALVGISYAVGGVLVFAMLPETRGLAEEWG